LELLQEEGPLVVNDPEAVRNAPEKLFVLRFKELMPPTLLTLDALEIREFWREHGDIIVKPLFGNGGAGVFHLKPDDENLGSLLELFTQLYREPVGAVNRVPAETESRSNMHIGGRAEKTELTPRERDICAAIGPDLRRRGFILVGIDVIGDYMTEINVTSPTGIREVKRFGGADIAALVWDAVEERRP
jgi:glutathione synthase